MVKLMAVLIMSGGCDHTIHCGTKVIHQRVGESKEEFIERGMALSGGEWGVSIAFYEDKRVKVAPNRWGVVE